MYEAEHENSMPSGLSHSPRSSDVSKEREVVVMRKAAPKMRRSKTRKNKAEQQRNKKQSKGQ
jgi:hypothetical protein